MESYVSFPDWSFMEHRSATSTVPMVEHGAPPPTMRQGDFSEHRLDSSADSAV